MMDYMGNFNQTTWGINGGYTDVGAGYNDFRDSIMLSDFEEGSMFSAGEYPNSIDCINFDGLQIGVNYASVTEPSSPILSTLQDSQNVNKYVRKEEPGMNDISVVAPSDVILPTHQDLQNENMSVLKQNNEVDNTKAAVTIKAPPTRLGRNIPITLEDLKQHFGSSLGDASGKLGVSRSTLKRCCRDYGIKRWPNSKGNRIKRVHSVNPEDVNNFQINKGLTSQTTSSILKIKAEYRDDIVKFPFSVSSGLVDLKKKVCERLGIDFPIKLKCRDDDGDLVLIACDEALDEQFGKISGRELLATSCLFSYKQIGYKLNVEKSILHRKIHVSSEEMLFTFTVICKGMFTRTIRLLEARMNLVSVFDGKPPDLKSLQNVFRKGQMLQRTWGQCRFRVATADGEN